GMTSPEALIVALTDAFCTGFNAGIVSYSKVTSQFVGVEALKEISDKAAVSLLLTTSSTFFSPPAVTFVLKLPSGAVNSSSYFPVIAASSSNSAFVEPEEAVIGMVYVSDFAFSAG